MGWKWALSKAVEVLLVVVLLSLIAGAVLGQPILLSFVETGSMEPTLDPGDGFVAVPDAVAGEVSEGDVVVFEAQQLHGGGLTTHRVVDETEAGYITRGDANPFTDQDGDEPPVTEGQIVAVALQLNGEVVVIPSLGVFVGAIQGAIESAQQTLAMMFGMQLFLGTEGLALILAGIGIATLAFGAFFDNDRRRRAVSRARSREGIYDPRRVVIALALFLAVVSGGTMAAMSTTHEYGMISAEFDSEDPTTVPAGGEDDLVYPAANSGQLPVYAMYAPASEHVAVDTEMTHINRGGEANVTVTFQPPDETGFYPQYVSEHRYFAVLPASVIAELYSYHPWLPTLAISTMIGGAFLVVGFAVVGVRPIRIRDTNRGSILDN